MTLLCFVNWSVGEQSIGHAGCCREYTGPAAWLWKRPTVHHMALSCSVLPEWSRSVDLEWDWYVCTQTACTQSAIELTVNDHKYTHSKIQCFRCKSAKGKQVWRVKCLLTRVTMNRHFILAVSTCTTVLNEALWLQWEQHAHRELLVASFFWI